MKTIETLLASSPNQEKLRGSIAQFYCRDNTDDVVIEGESVILSGKQMTGVKVQVKRGRFRFLMVRPADKKGG